jgi:hypothetical protein
VVKLRKKTIAAASLAALALAAWPVRPAAAATTTTVTFAGTVTSSMSVNNGTNVGFIGAGTPYTGALEFDAGQAPSPAAYGGGTHTVYNFTTLAFPVGSSTANSGPGRIDVYDNLVSAQGYPNGDSVYVNFAGVAPSGLLAGAQFNWMGLALLDPAGVAVSSGQLPADLNSANFPTHFSEFNFGTKGTPWGAGNTSMIQSLTSLSTSGVVPPPPPPPPLTIDTASLPSGTTGTAYSAPISVSWGVAPYNVTVSGLPAGLSFDGTNIAGTPTVAGQFPITVNAADAVGGIVSKALTMSIAQGANYTIVDESKGQITAIAPDYSFVMVGTKKLVWNASTLIIVNTPNGERHVVDSFVKVGMKVQWKGLRDRATNTVLTKQIEIN